MAAADKACMGAATDSAVANTSGLARGLLPAAISADAFLYVILSSHMCCV